MEEVYEVDSKVVKDLLFVFLDIISLSFFLFIHLLEPIRRFE
jgi:hypothetical protein